jgi:hypothetical protein
MAESRADVGRVAGRWWSVPCPLSRPARTRVRASRSAPSRTTPLQRKQNPVLKGNFVMKLEPTLEAQTLTAQLRSTSATRSTHTECAHTTCTKAQATASNRNRKRSAWHASSTNHAACPRAHWGPPCLSGTGFDRGCRSTVAARPTADTPRRRGRADRRMTVQHHWVRPRQLNRRQARVMRLAALKAVVNAGGASNFRRPLRSTCSTPSPDARYAVHR